MEQKYSAQVDIKATGNRQFEAYAATFGNKDSYGDIIMPGAFSKTITERTPKLCYQHDVRKLPGVIRSAKEDNKGLLVTGEFVNTPLGDEVYELVKMGAINQMSIGYSVVDLEYEKEIRYLKSVDLYEVSFVTFPANEQAVVTSVKGIQTVREFEEFLCKAGFSKERAKFIASSGFKGSEREAGADSENTQREAEVEEMKKAIIALTNSMKGA